MNNLIVAPTHRCFGIGDKNDCTVLDKGRCIGHIVLSRQAPKERPWFGTILPTTDSRGYSATREQAMANFKSQWWARMGKDL